MSQLIISSLSQKDTLESGVDTFDVALGYVNDDTRSIKNLLSVRSLAKKRIAFIRSHEGMDTIGPKQEQHDACIKKLRGFQFEEWTEQALVDLVNTLYDIAAARDDHSVSCYIDVSAIHRTWLAELLYRLHVLIERDVMIRVTLGYRLAKYTKPSTHDAPPNRSVSPVHFELAGWPRSPGMPVHVLVGLGYERGKALGAVEYIQPAQWRLFVPVSPEEKFMAQVQLQNKELLDGTRDGEIFVYNVLDPAGQYVMLHSMLKGMVADTKPVLLPFGPKIFFAISVILGLQFPEVSVWHVSGEEQAEPDQKRPTSHSVHFSFTMSFQRPNSPAVAVAAEDPSDG
ncbi:MAG: hypothetical protein EPN68_06485 [Rhodanobacter sp.]|nr:MAG: hypothetical protein EPN68_06485 [Rhodanobacter sp.]